MYQRLQKKTSEPKSTEPLTKLAPMVSTRAPAWTNALGNQPPITLQPKLTINQPGDQYEREADHVAAQVMRLTSSPVTQMQRCACGGMVGSDGECASCKAKRLGIQRKADSIAKTEAPPSVHQTLNTSGQPLDASTRNFMEPRFGQNFSDVRVHTDSHAAQSAADVSASAYTVGNSVVFGAGQYTPETDTGKHLLSHELSHVVQQRRYMGKHLQRAPGGKITAHVKALESLEKVAQRIARLAVGASSDAAMKAVNLEGGPGPVISVVRNIKTGELYVGLNTGTPAKLTEHIEEAIEAHKKRILAGEVNVVHTAADAVGGHAEVNALNSAIADEQAALGRAMTSEEIGTTFEMHNVWLSGKKKLTTAPRCEHCAEITRDVKVTESLFKAEDSASAKIKIPQRGKVIKTGGKTVETGTIAGEIPAPKPAVKPTTSLPEQVPEVIPEVKVSGIAGKSTVKLAVLEISLNVLLFALAYYLERRHAKKEARKLNNDLKGLLPEVNNRLKNKEAEVVAKGKEFPLVYSNVTIVYTRDQSDDLDYNEGSMSIQDMVISHQNYQTEEKIIRSSYWGSPEDPQYALTFSVPLFEEETAEKGASNIVTYRKIRETLTDSSYKVRLSAVLALAKLAHHDSSLKTLVVRDMLGMLKDKDAIVRLVAAVDLSALKAKVAIQYIPEIIPLARNDDQKKLIQRYLSQLEQE